MCSEWLITVFRLPNTGDLVVLPPSLSSVCSSRRTAGIWGLVDPLRLPELTEIHSHRVIKTCPKVAHKIFRPGFAEVDKRNLLVMLTYIKYVNSFFLFPNVFRRGRKAWHDSKPIAALKSHNFRLMITEMENWFKVSCSTLFPDRPALHGALTVCFSLSFAGLL